MGKKHSKYQIRYISDDFPLFIIVNIILDIEEEFGIVINNELMEKMLTVKATIAIIVHKLSEVIGSYLIDLECAAIESNWQRRDY